VAPRAILFDLGHTLVRYYTSSEFPVVLRRCLRECARALGQTEDPSRDEDMFERALLLNREQSDYAVRPLAGHLHGSPIKLPNGTTVPRPPGSRRWLWDDEFCGSIGLVKRTKKLGEGGGDWCRVLRWRHERTLTSEPRYDGP
jgi:hypothetical protein